MINACSPMKASRGNRGAPALRGKLGALRGAPAIKGMKGALREGPSTKRQAGGPREWGPSIKRYGS